MSRESLGVLRVVMRSKSVNRCGSLYSNDSHANSLLPLLGLTELLVRTREVNLSLASRKGHIVVLFCDEAQRQSRNSCEWLRDVHDQLAYHGIRLITFLIGQPQLLAQKAGFQMSGDEQIVARFMIEQLLFHGIRDAAEAATCLAGYDRTRYPEGSGPSFTGFFPPRDLPLAFGSSAAALIFGMHLCAPMPTPS
jgi:hypothetical protein